MSATFLIGTLLFGTLGTTMIKNNLFCGVPRQLTTSVPALKFNLKNTCPKNFFNDRQITSFYFFIEFNVFLIKSPCTTQEIPIIVYMFE
jgi:hypothetical protein